MTEATTSKIKSYSTLELTVGGSGISSTTSSLKKSANSSWHSAQEVIDRQ